MRDFADWVHDQHTPDGLWCCDISDGRPLNDDEIRIVGDHYEVLYTTQHWRDGTDEWLVVPKQAVLPQVSPMGVPIAWILGGRVYCLAMSGAV